MTMNALKTPFTNLPIELLRLYAHQVSEEDLIQIKDLIGQFFCQAFEQHSR